MPPKGSKKSPLSAEQAKASGLSLMTRFFTPPAAQLLPECEVLPDSMIPLKKRGRPQKAETRGRPSINAATPPGASIVVNVLELSVMSASFDTPPADHGCTPPEVKETQRTKHTDWSKPEHLERLTIAVDDWLNKTGEWLSLTPGMSLHMYCGCVGISKSTLHGYVHPDSTKRTQLGSHKGAPSLVKPEVQEFAVDVVRRRDRGNEGLTNRDTAEMIQDLVPHLTTQQVTDSLRKTIRPKFKSVLTNIVKAQASTTKRSQITVAQQYIWHSVH